MVNKDLVKINQVPFASMLFDSNVAIFGYGRLGKKYLRIIRETKRLKVIAIIDSYLDDDNVDGIPLCKPTTVLSLPVDYIILAVESKAVADDMKSTLLDMGVDENKIIWQGINCDNELVKEYTKFLFRFLQAHKERFFLFMLPEHGNTGDYAIGYGAVKFFRDYFPGHQVVGVTTAEWITAKECFLNIVRPDDVIFFNGGGYWGDLRGDEFIYRDIVESFPVQKKIFLPNTLTYKKESFKNNKFSNDMEFAA